MLTIIDILRVEHRLLRVMMAELGMWLPQATSPESIRERATVLVGALEDHARLEEQRLFAPLRDRSDSARHLVI